MKKNRSALFTISFLAVLFLFSCTISDGGIPRPYTRSIGPNGGTIADPAGATLIIPAGALTENTRITVTTYQDTLDFGTAFPVLAGALFGVKLEPEGLEFAAPVTLQIAPTATLIAGNEYPAFWHDAAADQWVQTGHATVAAGGAYVETTITHFSDYGIFDMPWDVLDDFDEFVAERRGNYPDGLLGDYYGPFHIDEESSFIGPDQYYNGCCYERAGVEMTIQYTLDGNQHSGYWTLGSTNEADHYTLSYFFSSGNLTYTIQLTVYLSCDQAQSNVWISSIYSELEVGERSKVYGAYLCGENGVPIPGRIFTFSLSGPGRLSRTTAVTDAEGEAAIEYIATQEGTAVITASLEGCACGAGLEDNPLVTTITVGGHNTPQWSGRLTVASFGSTTFIFSNYNTADKTVVYDPTSYDYRRFDGSLTVDFTLDSIAALGDGFYATGSGTARQNAGVVYYDHTQHRTERNYSGGELRSSFDETTADTYTAGASSAPSNVSDVMVSIQTYSDDPNQAVVTMSFGSEVPSDRNFFYRIVTHCVEAFHNDKWHYITGSATTDTSHEFDLDSSRSSLSFRVNLDGPSLEEGTYLATTSGIFLPEGWPTESSVTSAYSISASETADLVLARIATE